MSFAATTSARRNLRPRYWIEIQGIEQVLVEQTFAPTDVVSGRTQLVVIQPEGIVPGESRLEPAQFAESGASLTVRLRDTSSRVLRALFASRTRRVTWLTQSFDRDESLTAGIGDELEVADNAGLPSAGEFIIGAETFSWLAKSGSTTLTGVARSLYGSRPQDHLGGADDGGSVFLIPTNWVGRRVVLKAVYIDEGGAPVFDDDDDVATLGAFRIEEHPQFVEGDEWELRCGPLHQAYAGARCYVGQREAPALVAGINTNAVSDGTIALDASSAALFLSGDAETRVRIDLDDGTRAMPVLVSTAAQSITVGSDLGPLSDATGAALGSGPGLRRPLSFYEASVTNVQHVAYLSGDSTRILLTLLLSRLGDGANDTAYDTLPGRIRDAFGDDDWRMGAAIDGDDVDVESFEAFIGEGPAWTLLLDEEVSVADLLLEWCRGVRAFWRVDAQGRLAATRLREKSTATSGTTSLTALDDSRLLDDSSEAVEVQHGEVATHVRLVANWDPLSGRFLATVDVVDAELAAQYPEVGTAIEIESKLWSVNARSYAGSLDLTGSLFRASPMQHADVKALLRRLMVGSTRPRVFLQHRFDWAACLVEVGDTVRVTNARAPELDGGTVATDALVAGKQVDLERCVVTLRLLLLERGFRVAPTGIVSSWNAGTLTATFDAMHGSGATPGDHFAAGWTVEMLDVSATPWTVAALTVASVTSTTMTFTGAPGFTPAAGVLVIPTAQAGEAFGVALMAPDDYAYQVPPAGTLDIDGFDDPRWS